MKVAAGEVIVLDAIKIPTQATHFLLERQVEGMSTMKPRGTHSGSGEKGTFLAAMEADGIQGREGAGQTLRGGPRWAPKTCHCQDLFLSFLAGPILFKAMATKRGNMPRSHSQPRAEVGIRQPWPRDHWWELSLSLTSIEAERGASSTSPPMKV